MEENGKIRRKRRNFTQISNYALKDPDLSLKAKGLYAMINYYLDIPDFVLYKGNLLSVCVEGKKAFNSAWGELKERGYLLQFQHKDSKNHWYYDYELLDNPSDKDDVSVYPKGVSSKGDFSKGVSITNTVTNNTVKNNTINNNKLNDKEELSVVVNKAITPDMLELPIDSDAFEFKKELDFTIYNYFFNQDIDIASLMSKYSFTCFRYLLSLWPAQSARIKDSQVLLLTAIESKKFASRADVINSLSNEAVNYLFRQAYNLTDPEYSGSIRKSLTAYMIGIVETTINNIAKGDIDTRENRSA